MDSGADSYNHFLNGDEDGCVEIIKNYKDGLIFYLNGFVCNIHTAEELAEDTFVKIITKKPKFKGKSSFKTWLYAIGRNIALNYKKKNAKMFESSIDEYSELICDEENLEHAYICEERKIIIHRAMKNLKEEYHQILWLIYFEDLSNKEAAIVMNKSVHNIETLVYRARKSLKAELKKEGFTYEEL